MKNKLETRKSKHKVKMQTNLIQRKDKINSYRKILRALKISYF